jgi:copper(I)-binding protein
VVRAGAAVAALVLAALLLGACGDGDTGEAAAVAGSGASDAAADVTITGAVIGEPAGPNAALYFTVQNEGEETGIVAARTDAVETTALHGHAREDGQMVMRAIDGPLPLPSGTTVLEPGGLHVMLMGAGVGDLAAGDVIPFTVELTDGSTVSVEASVVPLTELVAGEEASDTTAEGHSHGGGG